MSKKPIQYNIVISKAGTLIQEIVLAVILDVESKSESELLLDVPLSEREFTFELPSSYAYRYSERRYVEPCSVFDLELRFLNKKGIIKNVESPVPAVL